MRIQQVEAIVGISRKNIRFYEEEGLIKPRRNAENGYREYSEADVVILKQVKLLRKLAVPIEEIRKLQQGEESLQGCMRKQLSVLEGEMENLRHIKEICACMEKQETELSCVDVDAYALKMEGMEKEGICFMNLEKKDMIKKKRAPVLSAGVMILLMGWVIGLYVYAAKADPIPWGLLIVLIAIPAAVIVGVLLALRQRMKEIEKGEEDATAEY